MPLAVYYAGPGFDDWFFGTVGDPAPVHGSDGVTRYFCKVPDACPIDLITARQLIDLVKIPVVDTPHFGDLIASTKGNG